MNKDISTDSIKNAHFRFLMLLAIKVDSLCNASIRCKHNNAYLSLYDLTNNIKCKHNNAYLSFNDITNK